MRIGLIYDVFNRYPWRADDPPDADAEYEPEETVAVLEGAVQHLGHEPVRVGTAFDLRDRLAEGLPIDAAINIAEGAHSRNREAYAPILLEMAGIPCLGSDALTLSLSLDKAWTKDLASAAGVPTPPHRVYSSADPIDADDLPAFPLFVKPRYEGTSKGITAQSRVETVAALREQVRQITTAYRQDALVEGFVAGGGEFTVAVVGNDPPDALPVLQRAVETTTGIGLHALEHRGAPAGDWDYTLGGTLEPALEAQLRAGRLPRRRRRPAVVSGDQPAAHVRARWHVCDHRRADEPRLRRIPGRTDRVWARPGKSVGTCGTGSVGGACWSSRGAARHTAGGLLDCEGPCRSRPDRPLPAMCVQLRLA